MIQVSVDDRWLLKGTPPTAAPAEFRVTAVDGDRVTLRSPGGGTDIVTLAELADRFRPDPSRWRDPRSGRLVEVGSRWIKGGELFTLFQIDHPPADRMLLRGDKGQVTGVSPLAELFDRFTPASAADVARIEGERAAHAAALKRMEAP